LFLPLLLAGCEKAEEVKHVTFQDDLGTVISEADTPLDSEINYPNQDMDRQDESHDYDFKSWELPSSNPRDFIFQATYNVLPRLCQVTFEGNGGRLVSGLGTPIPPVYEKDGYYFTGFDQELILAEENNTYTAEYYQLTISNITSMELIEEINFGFNYVNGVAEDNDDGAIYDMLMTKGINAISLTINWFQHCDENYLIDEEYLAQVKSKADPALDRGMYVILSTYDNYTDMWSSLNYNNYDDLMKITTVQWAQIGQYFIEYDEHLLFSFLNEPRDYRNNSVVSRESAHILNDANELFVGLIRSQGYNNAFRHLLITTIWGSSAEDNYRYIKFPDDERVILSLHAYRPFGLVHDSTYDEVSWTANEAEYQMELLNAMKTIHDHYLAKEIPVLMTEFGSRNKYNDPERAEWLEFYVSCAYSYGIKCFIWETSKTSEYKEFSFGILNRVDMTWYSPEISSTIEDIFVDGNFLPFYKEAVSSVHYLNDPIVIPKTMENLITGEVVPVTVNYDRPHFSGLDGIMYAAKVGRTIISVEINGYTHYYSMTILEEYKRIVSDFILTSHVNTEGIQQCYIETPGFDTSRVKYDWFSSDESIVRVNTYSSILIYGDGIVGITAVHKDTGAIGVVELEIVDGKIIRVTSLYEEWISD